MVLPTIIMAILAFVLVFAGYLRGRGEEITGIRTALSQMIELLPLLFFSFLVAGLMQTFLTRELMARWIGPESGLRGILIGALAGSLAPGGPYVSMPLAAGFLRTGASIGTMVAFMTGWSLWGVTRMPIEIGIMGWKFVLFRLSSTFFFPPLAGVIAQILFGRIKLF